MDAIELKNLTKKFGQVIALDNVNMKFKKGVITVLLGPSGCGKTTCMRCVAGLERPDSGEIYFEEKLVSSKDVFLPPSKRNIGMVFQSYAIWPHMTVFDNVAYPLKILKLPQSEIHKKVEEALNLVRLEGLGERYATQLSGGQQQRVALARALVYDPTILLLDEPLSNLDARLRESTRFELKELQSRLGTTVIYVTHDQGEALVLADELAVMKQGKIVEIGTSTELYKNPKSKFTAEFIGLSNFILGVIAEHDTEKKKVMVNTQSGTLIEVDVVRGYELNEEVIIMIRPEDVDLYRHKTPRKGNFLEGRVRGKAFLGNIVDYMIEVSGIGSFRVQKDPSVNFNEGDKVLLYLDPAYCRLIKLE